MINHHNPLTLPDDQVRFRPKSTYLFFEQAVAMTTLRHDPQTADRQGAGQKTGDIVLEQSVHLEKQGVAID